MAYYTFNKYFQSLTYKTREAITCIRPVLTFTRCKLHIALALKGQWSMTFFWQSFLNF